MFIREGRKEVFSVRVYAARVYWISRTTLAIIHDGCNDNDETEQRVEAMSIRLYK